MLMPALRMSTLSTSKKPLLQAPSMLVNTPEILYAEIPGTKWSPPGGDVGSGERFGLTIAVP